ncbi:MAG: hypothetical protein K2X81_27790 [Candidatus Obscuribacterales bacterium]|nr:hypothetical protein [Candidatus Obscuribacterales bacterium]
MTTQVGTQMLDGNSNSQSVFFKCLLLLSFMMLNLLSPAFAQDIKTSSMPGVDVVQKSCQTSPVVKAAAQSIMCMMQDMHNSHKDLVCVKVPSHNYAGILQELQNHDAKFVLPGAEIPAEAKTVFQLEAEHAGLRQTVYFL